MVRGIDAGLQSLQRLLPYLSKDCKMPALSSPALLWEKQRINCWFLLNLSLSASLLNEENKSKSMIR
ncbi:hypothetical protein QVD17_35638 [Tagetes erecta]|uniref:Uncharacterized protein n=1 Tax=Tagetes erecta TaxID=13708 RepID=A0AAD8NIE8_TARER|nr:hypothetical protein QVD17_35638 [Tagetes erecta]